MKKISICLLVLSLFSAGIFAQPVLKDASDVNEEYIEYSKDYSVDLASFYNKNMVEIIPVGKKVTLENFAGTKGPQDIFGYSISKYEVTQELYQAVTGANPSHFKGKRLPVENVTWYDAVYFCNELTKITMGEENCCYTITRIEKNKYENITSATVTWDREKKGYRLPTRAEWEMAARGGVNGGWDYSYSGSNDIDEVAWYTGNAKYKSHDVGTKKPNEAGLYDMSGNVWEWCWDSNDYNKRYGCGGCWGNYGNSCLVYSCNDGYANCIDNSLGFRLVCTVH